mgnify:FL=1
MTTSERMYNHLLSQFRNKQNIKAFLDVIGTELDEIDKVREQLRTQIWPSTAVGKQLDICGEVAGISRRVENALAMDFFGFPDHGDMGFGMAPFRRMYDSYLTSSDLNDRYYRLAIISKIEKNTTDCSRVSTIHSIKNIFNVERVSAVNAGNAKMRIGIGRLVTSKESRLIDALNLIIRGTGIGIIYVYSFDGANTFGFSRRGENPYNFKGFNEGTFARIIKVKGGLVE